MKRARIIYQTTPTMFSINPLLPANAKALNAFWVFLEFMEGVDIQTVMNGPYPAQITYLKNNRIYHIVSCSESGNMELSAAAMLEIEKNQRARKGRTSDVEERFIFVFSSEENMRKAALTLKSNCMFCVIKYPDKSTGIPEMGFFNPNEL